MTGGATATDIGTSLVTLLLAAGAAVESWRARRAARAGRAGTETVVEAVTPGGDVTRRLETIERQQREQGTQITEVRRAVDRVENDVATHLQLHTFMGSVRQRWRPDLELTPELDTPPASDPPG